jgi:hypothetical protein
VAGPVSPQTVTLANVASSATSVTLFAATTGRVNMRKIFNDSTAVLYVAEDGSVASTSNYSEQIAPLGYYEMPGPGDVPGGKITGIWASANGNARLTSW